jgi:hypothetical protein
MVRGGGRGSRRWFYTSPKQGGAKGSTKGSTRGQESGLKKTHNRISDFTLLAEPYCCSPKNPNKVC